MKLWHRIIIALIVSIVVAAPLATAAVRPSGDFNTLAVTYREGQGTTVDIVGTAQTPGTLGQANVKRRQGRTQVRLHLAQPLPHPQTLGSLYAAYVLWAIAPEGRAESLAELPHSRAFDVDATTTLGTFGLIVTAEPHGAVQEPGPRLVAENALRPDTKGRVQTTAVTYAPSSDLDIAAARAAPDFGTSLSLLGARRAVAMARAAGAVDFADEQLREAEVKLAALEQIAGGKRNLSKDAQTMSGEVMRLAEHARALAIERQAQARVAAERRATSAALSRAETEAERAQTAAEAAQTDAERSRERAEQARSEAASYREALERAQRETAVASDRVKQAQTEAERARASEDLAKAEAEEARLKAEEARQQTADIQDRLYQSLSAILETRREARGLIVNLSDVLFDFNRATLKPGAREKLSKLSGILLAYPGPYRIEIEGHTDSIGSHEYNQRLSQDRGESVSAYVLQAGIPRDRLTRVTGFGETRPVASNDNAAGRQMNRRVEIVITDLDRR